MRSNLVLAIALRFIGVFLSFLLNVYLSRILEKDTLGIYFFLSQIVLVLSVFLRGGTDVALLKYGQRMSVMEFISLSKNYVTSSILPVLFLICSLLLFCFIFIDTEVFLAIAFVAVSLIPFTIFNILAEFIKSNNNQISSTLIQTCFLPVIIFLIFNLIVSDIFVSYMSAVIVIMLTSIMYIKRFLTSHHDLKENQTQSVDFKLFWDDSKGFLMIGILNVTMNSMDLLMLGMLTEPKYVAEYGIANKLVALSSIVLVAINGVLGPKFATLWSENNKKQLNELFVKSTFSMLVISLITLIIFVLLGGEILRIVYGQSYEDSFPLLRVLALGQAVVLATGPVAYLLMMTNSKKAHQRSLVLAVILNLILNGILIPLYGAMGAAVATAVGLIAKNIYSFSYLIFRTEFRINKNVE